MGNPFRNEEEMRAEQRLRKIEDRIEELERGIPKVALPHVSLLRRASDEIEARVAIAFLAPILGGVGTGLSVGAVIWKHLGDAGIARAGGGGAGCLAAILVLWGLLR